MTAPLICGSCGMPIESGRLQPFDVRFDRMVQWMLASHPELGRAEAERRTRGHMRTMPAWKDHPRLAESD